tara:strand:+ start:94 stop:246 length:153 start_codon:yes stop_codon:yes gene_type:complete
MVLFGIGWAAMMGIQTISFGPIYKYLLGGNAIIFSGVLTMRLKVKGFISG